MSNKIKVNLLSDGSYGGMESVTFPVEVYVDRDRVRCVKVDVNGSTCKALLVDVNGTELERIGGVGFGRAWWSFTVDTECEVIE